MMTKDSSNVGIRWVCENAIRWQSDGPGAHEGGESPSDVEASLRDRFRLRKENLEQGQLGFRAPQVGALHAILAHKSIGSPHPITIVMPTGTGKTETMVAAFCEDPVKTLILVPSDALRDQISEKFRTLGMLPRFGAIVGAFKAPFVGIVKSSLEFDGDVDELAAASNVLVATPAVLDKCSSQARARLAVLFARLFVDEAHHVAANTWRSVAALFRGKEIVQFTATPFREDGKALEAQIAYAYPLRLAQSNGYFSRINYHSIVDLGQPDRALAMAALAQLRADLNAGLDHILMARVKTVKRAREVYSLYEKLAPEMKPIRLDREVPAKARKSSLEQLFSRTSRVIVCVNMLGEGFDLSSLKIAAIHDPQRGLAVSLQFIGRFTRVGGLNLGEASAFVPGQRVGADSRLRALYSEDADWNVVIQDLTETVVSDEKRRSQFEASFGSLPSEIAMASIHPRMSTVIYQSEQLGWNPDRVLELFDGRLFTTKLGVNHMEHVVWWISAERSPVGWGDVAQLQDHVHHLYVVHCDLEGKFLYINSTDNDTLLQQVAMAIGGPEVRLVEGDQVYRVLSTVNRRVPTNVGLLDAVNRKRRFSMHVGQDVLAAWRGEGGTKIKTNIFAHGFADGRSVSFGASRKGRVWSYQVARDIHDWVEWARRLGPIVTDHSIKLKEVMAGFILPTAAVQRPDFVPLSIEWPPELVSSVSDYRQIAYKGSSVGFIETELRLVLHSSVDDIQFEVATSDWSLRFQMSFHEDKRPTFAPTDADGKVLSGKREQKLSDFLNEHGVVIHFEGELLLTNSGYILKPEREQYLFPKEAIEVFDWSNISITTESQGKERNQLSVQFRTIEHLSKEAQWDIIVDDDGAGELADIVLLRRFGSELEVCLVHCKFSSEKKPGARIKDLYEVCGQAIKMNRAKSTCELLTDRLLKREQRRLAAGISGLILGNYETLARIAYESRFLTLHSTVIVVQPGISKSRISDDMRALLGGTERFLSETHGMKFRVAGSP